MKMRNKIFVICAVWLFSCALQADPFIKSAWPNTNFENAIVSLDEIMSGGPPKDGIPSIDEPKFDSVEQARTWLEAREPIILVRLNEEARAYPLQLLIYHEIINDQIGDTPVSVTFCPLCNSSVIFDRRHKGKVLDFGTTGLLRKSDMVMYDRQTETWWQQIIGQAIIGELAGDLLTQLPSSIVSFDDFAKAYPQGKVVNRQTGHRRAYGNNPYYGYDTIGQKPFLYHDKIDPRLPAMERVMHVKALGEQKLYPFSVVKEKPVLNDLVGQTPIVLFGQQGLLSVLDQRAIADSRSIQAVTVYRRDVDEKTLEFEVRDGVIVDKQTQSHWNTLGQAIKGEMKGSNLAPVQSGIHFAFAWLAFNPGIQIFALP